MSQNAKSRREKAAAASAAASSDERRRERTVRIVGIVVVVAVVLGIIGIAWWGKTNSSKTAGGAEAVIDAPLDPSAALPATVLPAGDPHEYGVPYGTAQAGSGVPVLAIWEDFQCPACDQVEKQNGAGIESLAEAGKVQLIWRATTFLDRNLGNDASARATMAWGCAIDAGKAREYHNTVFANQPEKEGDGYSDDQLVSFAEQSGITGADLDTFKACFTDRKYRGWAGNTSNVFTTSGVQGTPYATLNGTELPIETLIDQAALEKVIADATATGASPAATSAASPSPAAS
jgi:protein-disulfide isomerase